MSFSCQSRTSLMEARSVSCETLADLTSNQQFLLLHTLMTNCCQIWREPNVTVYQSSYLVWILRNCLVSPGFQPELEFSWEFFRVWPGFEEYLADLCFDTTSGNTGIYTAAITIVQQSFNRCLLLRASTICSVRPPCVILSLSQKDQR